ncbi:MAG: DUF4912 domain-containing protein [Thermincola sp.]|jgi:hypothetical protein|nr:DUF4912 domain-containing protein [Thermincola sp.]
MNNLETIGLILVLSFLVFLGSSYLITRNNRIQDKISLQDKSDDFEAGEEIFPLIQFPPEIKKEHVPELPPGYNDDKITVMARDPETIFAYWDISKKKRNSMRHSVGPIWDSSLPVLRVHDVTRIAYFDGTNSNQFFDVPVDDFSGNWYVAPAVPNRTYCIELGRVLSDGTFVVMARSNFTSTPNNCVSDLTDPDWMLVSDNQKKLFARIGNQTGISSGEMQNQ